MLLIIFKLIVFTTLLVLGYTIITQEGMGLYWIRVWAEKKRDDGSKWVEPVLICHWCQPSSFGILGYAFAYGTGVISEINWRLIVAYPIVVCGASLLSGLIWSIHEAINAAKENHETITRNLDEEYYRNEPAYYEETNKN